MAFDVAEEYVAKAEAALGARLPESYRRHMMDRNGGVLLIDGNDDDWQLHPIFDGADKKRAARTCNDIVRETAACAAWNGFPPLAVAIADNGSGDRIVFLRSEACFLPEPQIWFHETRRLIELAKDFGEL